MKRIRSSKKQFGFFELGIGLALLAVFAAVTWVAASQQGAADELNHQVSTQQAVEGPSNRGVDEGGAR